MFRFNGNTHRLSTSNKRNSFGLSCIDGIINESNLILLKSEYSYLQYHWCPIALIVIFIEWTSSLRYKILIDGTAIITRTTTGSVVHVISTILPCSMNRSVYIFNVENNITIKIISVMKIKIIIVKSWK